MIKYLDPYKDTKYGKLKGDKANDSCKIEFKEGKFHKVDDGYVLMADVTKYHGVVRAFKPEESLNPGICAIPIYNKDYEIWEKGKDGKSEAKKVSPSVHELNLCTYLDKTISEDNYYQGSLAFLPNYQLSNLPDEQLIENITRNCQLLETDSTGNLLAYEVPTNNYKKNGYSKLTPKDKLKWLKTELCSSIKGNGFNEEMSLIDLIDQVVTETQNENVLAIYTDCIKALMN